MSDNKRKCGCEPLIYVPTQFTIAQEMIENFYKVEISELKDELIKTQNEYEEKIEELEVDLVKIQNEYEELKKEFEEYKKIKL